MISAFYQGTLREVWIALVEAISGQPQNKGLAYKLVDRCREAQQLWRD